MINGEPFLEVSDNRYLDTPIHTVDCCAKPHFRHPLSSGQRRESGFGAL